MRRMIALILISVCAATAAGCGGGSAGQHASGPAASGTEQAMTVMRTWRGASAATACRAGRIRSSTR